MLCRKIEESSQPATGSNLDEPFGRERRAERLSRVVESRQEPLNPETRTLEPRTSEP
jgi:hypothetical protein